MKRYLFNGLAVFVLILFVGPVLIHQVLKPEGRRFRAVRLEDTKYTEVSFQNTSQKLSLAALLFVPEGDGPFPAVVIVHGSGTSSRDNGWYLTLTDYLQTNGIIVLLPDKRGSEKSGGNWRNSSLEDLATDTISAIDYLKKQKEVPVSSIGIVGMSEGGRIAPIIANESSDVAFVVNVVGGALSSHDQLFYEENYNVQEMGFLPGISNIVSYFSTYSLIYLRQKEFWDAVGDFDPVPHWEKVSTPALVLYGKKDTNVNSAASARLLNGLKKQNITVKVFEGSGHPLEDPVGTGNSIFRIDALNEIGDFVKTNS
ncbi:MAG: alpha/beta fold hydrolase [Pyrinomonadaceae bacterium]|nr:alpha/beta fold hydrolase [Pyrinomonadaceae bacterium]